MIDRATLAAIHVAKKDRGLDDDAYRDMMERVAGVRSASALDANGARLVMLEFERLGFAGTNNRKGTAGDRRPIVLKARALWISLWQLDEIHDSRDSALDAFTKRTTGKETLRFCTNGEAGKVVEALKAWCERVGFHPRGGVLNVVYVQETRLRAYYRTDWPAALTRRAPLTDSTPSEQRDYAAQLAVEVRRLKLGHRHRDTSLAQGQDNA